MERGRRPPPAPLGPAARPPGRVSVGRAGAAAGAPSAGSPPPRVPAAGPARCPAPRPWCHGRLGFLGMGFAACHKSHCQGFPTDPEPCLRGRHCHCRR
ncbi:hypothetical protein AB1E18_006171 [Capra hircus]